MRVNTGWASALAVALVLVSGCAGNAASPAASAAPQRWTDLTVDCPPLTAPGFADAQPLVHSRNRQIDDAELLGVMCSYYREGESSQAVDTRLQIDRDPAKSGYSAEVVASDRDTKKAKGQAVVELSGFEGLATASSDGWGPVEAVTFAGNARLFAIVTFDVPVTTEAAINERRDVLAAVLRDMIGNLSAG